MIDYKETGKHYLSVAAAILIALIVKGFLEPNKLTVRNIFIGIVGYVVNFAAGQFFLWKSRKEKGQTDAE